MGDEDWEKENEDDQEKDEEEDGRVWGLLGVISEVEALSLRWRSPENCHEMFESCKPAALKYIKVEN